MAKAGHEGKNLSQIADLYGIGRYDAHFFLCTGPDCCTEEEGAAAWKALKAKIKALFPRMRDARIYRTRVRCLRMCQEGPTAVCYPQGKWYHGVTAGQIDELIDHIHSGNPAPHPLEFTANPLPRPE